MTRYYRVLKGRWVATAFSGYGASLTGGRWNSTGTGVVYVASSLSLAMLETLVHFDTRTAPPGMVMIEVDVPGAIHVERVGVPDLPTGWRRYPAPGDLARIGDEWVQRGRSAILEVPSVIVPSEFNALLNPAHADFQKIVVGTPQPVQFDTRLFVLKKP